MAELPQKLTDPPLKFGDTGDAVKKLQDFLQSLPEVQKAQNFLKDFGKGFSFKDANIYGNFEKESRLYLSEYQKRNKERIKKVGNLSDADFDKILGTLDYSTWRVIQEDSGQSTNSVSTKPVESQSEQVESPKVPDPPQAADIGAGTHFVLTKDPKSRLALRYAPAYVKVGKNAWEDTKDKGQLILMMDNGTILKVIEWGVGFECLWAQVEVTDLNAKYDKVKEIQKTKKVFCFAEFIHPLDKTAPLLPTNCEKCIEQISNVPPRKIPFPDWTKLTECEPFFDEPTCGYYITITTEHESTDDLELEQQKKEALLTGVELLLEFYDKQRDFTYVQKLMTSYQFAEVKEWFLDERPNSKLKFLVKIPSRFFDAIPRQADFLSDIPNVEGSIPFDWKTTHFYSSKIRKNIEYVAKDFEEYAKDADKWTGTTDIDLRLEAKRLRSFIPVFVKFLKDNDFELREKEEDTFEIGFEGPCFQVAYVLINQTGVSVPLRIGFDCFKRSEPVKYERTMGYIFYLEAMIKDLKRTNRKSWIKFVQEYSCPLPDFNSGKPTIDTDGPLKTTEQKENEDLKIFNTEYRENTQRERSTTVDFVGDDFLSCEEIVAILDRVQTLDDVYKEVLNRVDLKTLISLVSSCLTYDFSPDELFNIGCQSILESMSYEDLNEVSNLLPMEHYEGVQNKIIEINRESPAGSNIGTDSEQMILAMRESIPQSEICKAINGFDPTLLSDFISGFSKDKILSKFKLPSLPTISVPDNLPTEDILSDVGKTIEDSVKQALTFSLISIIRTIFESLCNACSNEGINNGERYGDIPFVDLVNKAGVNFNIISSEITDEDILKNFFDDLSAMLLPSEVCSLINGDPPQDVVNIIENLIDSKYPSLRKIFPNKEKIKELFLLLGQYVDKKVCEQLNERIPDSCENVSLDKFRKCILEGRMSSKQIDEQLSEKKKRNAEKIKLFSKLNESFFQGVIPNFDNKNCFLNKDPLSVSYLNEKTVDVMFSGIQFAFENDVSSFLQGMISNLQDGLKTDVENFKKAYDIRLKKLSDLSKEDSNILMSDMLSGLFDSKNITILPDLKQSLSTVDNFVKKDGVSSVNTTYVFNGTKSRNKELEEIRKNISLRNKKATKEQTVAVLEEKEQSKLAKPTSIGGLVNTSNMSSGLIQQNKECEQEKKEKQYTSYITEITEIKEDLALSLLSDKSLVEYLLLQSKDIHDTYRTIIDTNTELLDISVNKNIDVETKNIISKMNVGLDDSTSPQQKVFSDFIVKLWSPILKNDIDKISKNDSEFVSYFRNDVFNKLTQFFIQQTALQISNSSLFNIKEFNKLDLLKNDRVQTFNTSCPPNNKNGLLNINEIKQNTKDKFDQVCGNNQQSAVETAGLSGATKTIVKIYILDVLLKNIFTFSTFKVADILNSDLFVKFVVEKIKADINKEQNEVKNIIFDTIKKEIGSGTINPNNTDEPNETIKNDPSSPDFISGIYHLEELIKIELNEISSNIESIFRSPKNVTLNHYFLNNWMLTPEDVPEAIESERFFVDVKGKQTLGKNRYAEGGLILEKYVRTKTLNGRGVDVVQRPSQFFLTEKEFGKEQKRCGNFGLRLTYIPELKSDSKMLKIMKKFNIDQNKAVQYKAFSLEKNMVFSIPLISVEDEEMDLTTDKPIGREEENKIIERLKQKLVETEEYKLLFRFVFPLERFLTLISIYNVVFLERHYDREVFENTKKELFSLIRTLTPDRMWWKREDPNVEGAGDNVGIRAEYMRNLTTAGAKGYESMARMTVPLLIKGLAETYDPSYKLIKSLGLPLNPGSILPVAPVNIFGPFGFGPPIGPYGFGALAAGLLPGEQERENQKEMEKKTENGEVCAEEDNK